MPRMNSVWLRLPASYVVAVLIVSVLGCAASTQFTLAGLVGFGIEVPWVDWLAATAHDVVGMGQTYALVAAVAFLPGFGIAAILLRWVPGPRPFWFAVAGGAAIVTAILLLRYLGGGTIFGGARTPLGLFAQALAGGVAGWLFAQLMSWRRSA